MSMTISTKGRYALRMLIDLAMAPAGEYVSIKKIAQQQQISEKYLEQIILPLKRQGIIESIRGAQGGYRLARPPEEYTAGMILRIIEGSLAPVPCVEASDEESGCPRKDRCVTIDVYRDIYRAVSEVVDGITLLELVRRQQIKKAEGDYPACPQMRKKEGGI